MRLGIVNGLTRPGLWRLLTGLLTLALLLLLSAQGMASVDHCLEPPDTASPHSTLTSFLANVNAAYAELKQAYQQRQAESSLFPSQAVKLLERDAGIKFQRAVQCLDLSRVPRTYVKDVGYESVILLKEILDRVGLPPLEEIPGNAEVLYRLQIAARSGAPVPGGTEVRADPPLTTWRIPHTQIEIKKVPEGPRTGEYLFTPETVDRLHAFYRMVAHLPYLPGASEGFYEFYTRTPGRLLPPKWAQWLPEWSRWVYLDQTLWQWFGLLLAFAALLLVPLLLHRWLRRRLGRQSKLLRTWLNLLLPATSALLAFFLAVLVDEQINITGRVLMVSIAVFEVVVWLMAAWGALLVPKGIAESVVTSPRIGPGSIDASLVRTLGELIGLAAAILILVEGASRLGIPIVPLLTGLGVAGLALSLAARPTLENVIGGLMLYLDRPVRVGDLCRFGQHMGEVVQIGLRSTRIRGLDRTLISIPNADFSQFALVNLTRRDRIRIDTTLNLRYETSPDQLRYVLAKIREMLLAHPKIYNDPARVRFIGFGSSSLDLQLYAFARTRDWNDFLGIQEDVYLRIMKIVQDSGTGFAFPSQTAYLTRDTGLDKKRAAAAEQAVDAWRGKGELPFPNFSAAQEETLTDTLPFPPEGAAERVSGRENAA